MGAAGPAAVCAATGCDLNENSAPASSAADTTERRQKQTMARVLTLQLGRK
jgi:hypothetical protein